MTFSVGDIVSFRFPLSDERTITGYVEKIEKIGYDNKVKVITFTLEDDPTVRPSYWLHPNNKHLKRVSE